MNLTFVSGEVPSFYSGTLHRNNITSVKPGDKVGNLPSPVKGPFTPRESGSEGEKDQREFIKNVNVNYCNCNSDFPI